MSLTALSSNYVHFGREGHLSSVRSNLVVMFILLIRDISIDISAKYSLQKYCSFRHAIRF